MNWLNRDGLKISLSLSLLTTHFLYDHIEPDELSTPDSAIISKYVSDFNCRPFCGSHSLQWDEPYLQWEWPRWFGMSHRAQQWRHERTPQWSHSMRGTWHLESKSLGLEPNVSIYALIFVRFPQGRGDLHRGNPLWELRRKERRKGGEKKGKEKKGIQEIERD